MKKLFVILSLVIGGNAFAACTHADKQDSDKREVASEEKAEQWRKHQNYLEKIDKIR